MGFQVRLTAGEHWFAVTIPGLFEGLPPSYNGPAPSSRPEPPPPVFKPRPDRTPEENEKRRLRFEEEHKEKPAANNARVSYVEIGGPYNQIVGPSAESTKRIFICAHRQGHHVPSCATRILTSLTRRAFRRPVTPVEVAGYAALVKAARHDGESFEQGIALALQAVLVSPDFLFRLEGARPSPDGAPVLLNEHELATRLSYFLWASMPDARLRQLATAGRLRAPGVLEGEIRRMLADQKSRALVEQFGGQWLQTRALESARPDPDHFPDFEDYLRLSMQRETELFFTSVMREDRSILDFLTARDTFLNERLARHYGISGVTGPEFRRVDLVEHATGGCPHAGQCPHRVLVRDQDLARTARQVDPRQSLRGRRPAAARERPTAERRGRRDDGVAAGADGSAPAESDVRLVSPADGSAGLRSRELRRRGRVAIEGRQLRHRFVRSAPRRTHVPRTGGAVADSRQRAGGLHARADVEDACSMRWAEGRSPPTSAPCARLLAASRPRTTASRGLYWGSSRASRFRCARERRANDRYRTTSPRRTFLKGPGCRRCPPDAGRHDAGLRQAGVCGPAPTRLSFVYVPNGVTLNQWTPSAAGRTSSSAASSSRSSHSAIGRCVLTGLAQKNGNALGDGPGDHARAAACYLTGVHPKKTAGADIQNGVSVDQIAAAHRHRDAVPVARAGMRRVAHGRQLRLGIQLRVHEQRVVAQSHFADAAGERIPGWRSNACSAASTPASTPRRVRAASSAPQHPRSRGRRADALVATLGASIGARWTST